MTLRPRLLCTGAVLICYKVVSVQKFDTAREQIHSIDKRKEVIWIRSDPVTFATDSKLYRYSENEI